MAKDPPTVTLTGIDATLIRIEGRFSQKLDQKVLNLQGSFIKQMDKAASQVFRAMSVDTQVGGNVARRVMGSHAGTPSFLVAEGAKWEPLSYEYLRRKRRLMSDDSKSREAGKVQTANFWEYSGGLKKAFRNQTERMARLSNNTQRYESLKNEKTGDYRTVFKPDPGDELFTPLRFAKATGKNLGTRAKNYDFVYDESTGASLNYSAKNTTKSGPVPDRYVKQMNRYIQFDVFRGYAQYISDTMAGKTATSPEAYLANEGAGKKRASTNPNSKSYAYGVTNTRTGDFEQKMPMGIKLFYRKNGDKHQRQLIQPYMRYYFKKIMVPLAKKLLKGKI